MNYSSNYSKLLTSLIASSRSLYLHSDCYFRRTVQSWTTRFLSLPSVGCELARGNLEPVCQKKNFPVISRGSSCYKYVQERSPRFFCIKSREDQGSRIPNIRCALVMWSNPSWNRRRTGCAVLLRFPVNSAHFDLFTVAKVCQLHTFSFSSQIRYLQVGITYRSCLYLWAYGDFVPCDPTGSWNCHTCF